MNKDKKKFSVAENNTFLKARETCISTAGSQVNPLDYLGGIFHHLKLTP